MMIEIVEFCAGWLKIKCPERYTYEITFTRLDGQPDEIQQHTSEELARECFRLFNEPDSAEMYSKIELGRHDWETGMAEILETMTF